MPRPFTPKVVTGNALVEGDVIYLTAEGSWTRSLSEAQVLRTEEEANARLTEAAARADEIVGAYLADVAETPAGPEPTHFREDFRRTGPSNYFLGKQAEVQNV